MKTAAAILAFGVLVLRASTAAAFDPKGHELIEAHAYLRVLAMKAIPGLAVDGQQVLLALINDGVLKRPKCTDARCVEEGSVEAFPPLETGVADLVLPRQSSLSGQCYHFMANTADLDEPDGDPLTHRSAHGRAFSRCLRRMTELMNAAVAADAEAPEQELTSIYALMHALTDSFSRAHVVRVGERFDEDVVALKPWRLLTWTDLINHPYVRQMFWTDRYHYAVDPRDEEYLDDGRYVAKENPKETDEPVTCGRFRGVNGYLVPEVCLTPIASRAADAVAAVLVLAYRIRAAHAGVTWPPSGAWGELTATYLGKRLEVDANVPSEGPEVIHRGHMLLGAAVASDGDRYATGALGFAGIRALLGDFPPVRPSEDLLFTYGHRWSDRSPQTSRVGFLARLNINLPVAERVSLGLYPFFTSLERITNSGWTWDFGSGLGELAIAAGAFDVLLGGPHWSWRHSSLDNGFLGSVALAFPVPNGKSEPAAPEAAVKALPTKPRTIAGGDSELVLGSSVCRGVDTAAGRVSRWSFRYGSERIDGHDEQGVLRGAFLGLGVYPLAIDGTDSGTFYMPTVSVFGRWRPTEFLFISLAPVVASGGFGSGWHLRGDVGAEATLAFVFGNRIQLRARAPRLSYVRRGLYNGELFAIELAASQ